MATTTTSSSEPFSSETYFSTQPPPSTLDHDVEGVRQFISRQAEQGRNVVLVTSGGTTVPLELNVVRFLDNFSAGTRGATSAEYFLQAGYSVIFMHRQFSLQPFSRHYSHSTNPFLDLLQVDDDSRNITVSSSQTAHLHEVLKTYKAVNSEGRLHTITFVTVNDYLWLLRAVSQELAVLKRRAMYFLAAAVSDFFLPRQKMSQHKIQSGKGSLLIEMDQVPKILKPMIDEWSKDGYIVSFKLETDQELLIPKARTSLERYGHQVVIGNELNKRKFEVVFVSKEGGLVSETWLKIDPVATEHGKEIEEDIVVELVQRHQRWINANIDGDIAAANKAHFDAHAHSYDATPFILETTEKIGAAIFENVPFTDESTTVMEYACGTGLVSNVLVPHSKLFVGVDISEGMIAQFQNRFEKQGVSTENVRAICQELQGVEGELGNARFDVVLCSMAYHHFDPSKLQNTTNILASFLNPGGHLVIVDNEPDPDGKDIYHGAPQGAIGVRSGFTEADMDKLFSGAGTSLRLYKRVTSFESPSQAGTWQNVFIAVSQKP